MKQQSEDAQAHAQNGGNGLAKVKRLLEMRGYDASIQERGNGQVDTRYVKALVDVNELDEIRHKVDAATDVPYRVVGPDNCETLAPTGKRLGSEGDGSEVEVMIRRTPNRTSPQEKARKRASRL